MIYASHFRCKSWFFHLCFYVANIAAAAAFSALTVEKVAAAAAEHFCHTNKKKLSSGILNKQPN